MYSPNLPDMVDSFSGLVGLTPASKKYFSQILCLTLFGLSKSIEQSWFLRTMTFPLLMLFSFLSFIPSEFGQFNLLYYGRANAK
jgi:hypothetical protein